MERLYDMIFTTSVFIAAVILLRAVVRNKISMRLRYALWLLVAVKLLVFPVPWLESVLSLQQLSVAEGISARPDSGEQTDGGAAAGNVPVEDDTRAHGTDLTYRDKTGYDQHSPLGNRASTLTRLRSLYYVCIGVAAVGSVFLFLFFWRKISVLPFICADAENLWSWIFRFRCFWSKDSRRRACTEGQFIWRRRWQRMRRNACIC